jgi:peptidyl-prolyl cis-trans isomerase B (cyclophilin B)
MFFMSKINITIVILVILGVIGMVFFLNSGNKQSIIPSIATTPTVNPTGDFHINGLGNGSQAAPQQQQQQALQQTASPTITPTASISATKAVIKTSKGDITVELYAKDAPKTVANFAKKSSSGFYDGLTFHRVEDWVIQGGDPKGDGTGGGQMPTELNDHEFVTGSLGVARGSDINVSNDSQFFITKEDASWLNGQYTNFGQVTDGMDVVNKIEIGDKILGITVQ